MLAKLEREAATKGEGCLGKASDDEPVFVLRAQDKLAPMLVDLWVSLAEAHGADYGKTDSAAGIADAMRVWQANNSAKWPD